MSELPSGIITVADLYRELAGMRTDVGRALEKLAVVETRNGDADRLHSDHETRLRRLEQFAWRLMGASVLAGMAAGIMANYITALLTARGH